MKLDGIAGLLRLSEQPLDCSTRWKKGVHLPRAAFAGRRCFSSNTPWLVRQIFNLAPERSREGTNGTHRDAVAEINLLKVYGVSVCGQRTGEFVWESSQSLEIGVVIVARRRDAARDSCRRR